MLHDNSNQVSPVHFVFPEHPLLFHNVFGYIRLDNLIWSD